MAIKYKQQMPSPVDDDIPPDELFESAKERLERRRRARYVAVVLPFLIGVVSLALLQIFEYRLSPAFTPIGYLVSLAMLALAVFSLVMVYLQTGFKSDSSNPIAQVAREIRGERVTDVDSQRKLMNMLKEQSDRHHMDLMELEEKLQRQLNTYGQIGSIEKNALVKELKAQIQAETAGAVLDDLKAQVAITVRRDVREAQLLEQFEQSRDRLSKELRALGYRGNLNLAFGAVMTAIGLTLLGWSVFKEVTGDPRDPLLLLSHFLPRLTLVLLIELFAFFFLSLYKTSLQEIKYFQNELTNVEAKQIALITAIDHGDKETVTAMVESLAATERNHVLSKDQTTVELEKARLDRDGRGDILRTLQDLIKKKDKE